MAAVPGEIVREAHLHEKCEEALRAAEAAVDAVGPESEIEETAVLEQDVVRLRDTLIDLLRQDVGKERKSLQSALEQVNTAISLVAGVEYPSRGPHRQLLEQARNTLRRLMRERVFRGG